MDAMKLIAERRRHQIAKGYDVAHDDEHRDRSIARAAGAYALRAFHGHTDSPHYPWGVMPPAKSPIDDLIDAAALCIAEIERIDRACSRVSDTLTDHVCNHDVEQEHDPRAPFGFEAARCKKCGTKFHLPKGEAF